MVKKTTYNELGKNPFFITAFWLVIKKEGVQKDSTTNSAVKT